MEGPLLTLEGRRDALYRFDNANGLAIECQVFLPEVLPTCWAEGCADAGAFNSSYDAFTGKGRPQDIRLAYDKRSDPMHHRNAAKFPDLVVICLCTVRPSAVRLTSRRCGRMGRSGGW